MGEISIFPLWFTIGLAMILALPVTTVIMAVIGIAGYRMRRRDRSRRLMGLEWAAIIVAPFWFAGLGFGGLSLVAMVQEQIAEARRYFTLDKAAEIDGLALPAGTRVELDDYYAVKVAELPNGATLALGGATWQGRIEFAEPAHAPNAAHGRIINGTLAASAVIDGIPCRAGGRATFFWGGHLKGCTLSQDTDVPATLASPGRSAQTQRFRCVAGDTIALDGVRIGELDGCRLADLTDLGDVACAAGERILISNGALAICTLAKSARFGPLTLPAATLVSYYDAQQPGNFRLPPQGASVEGFGLSLPAGTEGSFCHPSEALEHLTISKTAYVTVEGVKLTGWIDFDCGEFRSGTLFGDTIIGGKWRQRGEIVSSEELLRK